MAAAPMRSAPRDLFITRVYRDWSLDGGTMFFSLAFLLSTVFHDVWRPLLLVFCVAFALGVADLVLRDVPFPSVVRLMSGETYFRTGSLPWPGLFASVIVSAALLYGAGRNLERRDF